MDTDTIRSIVREYLDEQKFSVAQIPAHEHTGVDSSQVSWKNLLGRSFSFPVLLSGTSAATSANYGVFFIAPFPCRLSRVQEVHSTAGTDGGAVTLTVEKLERTTAPGAGTSLVYSQMNLKGAANTPVTAVLQPNDSLLTLEEGDRLALKSTGTLTSLAGVCVIIEITI